MTLEILGVLDLYKCNISGKAGWCIEESVIE